jgi:hypothetical protein
MPQDVIDRVHTLARRSNANRDLTFAWRDGTAIDDDDDDDNTDSEWEPESDDDSDYELVSTSDDDGTSSHDSRDDEDDTPPEVFDLPLAGVDDEEDANSVNENNDNKDNKTQRNADENEIDEVQPDDEAQPDINETIDDETTGVDDGNTGVADETTGVDDNPPTTGTILPTVDTVEEDVKEDMDIRYGERTGRHNLRPRRKPNDKYIQAVRPQDHSQLHATLEHYAMTQHSVKKGRRLFGKAGKEAVYSEMQQLHEMEVIEPKMATGQRSTRQFLVLLVR